MAVASALPGLGVAGGCRGFLTGFKRASSGCRRIAPKPQALNLGFRARFSFVGLKARRMIVLLSGAASFLKEACKGDAS